MTDDDIKLAGEALEIIRRSAAFAESYGNPHLHIVQAHDCLRAFIRGEEWAI